MITQLYRKFQKYETPYKGKSRNRLKHKRGSEICMIFGNLPTACLRWILSAISLGQCKIVDFKCLIKVPLPPVLPAVANTCTLGICLPNTNGSQQWYRESSHLPCCSSNAFRSMLHRGCFYSLKNFKETIWMLTQMSVAVCPNHWGLLYSSCQSRALSVSTALRATGQLSRAQSNVFLPACSTDILSAPRQQHFCA